MALTARGFEVWFDRMAMPSRGLTFHQEIQDAVAARESAAGGVLVVGPKAAVSNYVRQEWQFALQADKPRYFALRSIPNCPITAVVSGSSFDG